MTTARTHRRNVGRGSHRPIVAAPKPDNFVPVSAETFAFTPDYEVEVFDPSTLDFDPADYNADDVKEFVTGRPETVDAVLELELNGKARSGLLTWLDNFNTESEN